MQRVEASRFTGEARSRREPRDHGGQQTRPCASAGQHRGLRVRLRGPRRAPGCGVGGGAFGAPRTRASEHFDATQPDALMPSGCRRVALQSMSTVEIVHCLPDVGSSRMPSSRLGFGRLSVFLAPNSAAKSIVQVPTRSAGQGRDLPRNAAAKLGADLAKYRLNPSLERPPLGVLPVHRTSGGPWAFLVVQGVPALPHTAVRDVATVCIDRPFAGEAAGAFLPPPHAEHDAVVLMAQYFPHWTIVSFKTH